MSTSDVVVLALLFGLAIGALAAALALLLAGPAAAWAQHDPDQLVMGVRAPIVTLDPAVSGLGTMHGYYQNIFDSLVMHDARA